MNQPTHELKDLGTVGTLSQLQALQILESIPQLSEEQAQMLFGSSDPSSLEVA